MKTLEQASLLHRQGRLVEARKAYEALLRKAPADKRPLAGYGTLLAQQGHHQLAYKVLSGLAASGFADPGLDFNLGLLAAKLGKSFEAEALYRKALAARPGFLDARINLANILLRSGRLSEAKSDFERVLSENPQDSLCQGNLAIALRELGQVSGAVTAAARAVQLAPADGNMVDEYLFTLLMDPATDNDTLFAEATRLSPPPQASMAHRNHPDPDRRLKIGLISGGLRAGHNLLYVLRPLIEGHDRQRFHVTLYGDVDYRAREQADLRHWAECCRDTSDLDDQAVAGLIARDGIDIAISVLGRGSLRHRARVLEARPAPIQLCHHHVMTTGSNAFDYWIGDRHGVPASTTERFAERVLRLPAYGAYALGPDVPVAPPPLLKSGQPTFGCFSSTWKINDGVIALWADIVKSCDGRMLIKGKGLEHDDMRALMAERFARHGIDAERLEVRGHTATIDEHLATYAEIDIALDTFPYSYGNTAFEALWMGVPVVSLAGDRFAGRISLSILRAAGHGEWVADTPQAYRDIALALAGDPAGLTELRHGLRPALAASSLCDGPRHVRWMERLLHALWRRWCAEQGSNTKAP